ncbi:MAG: hypothetical protein ACI8WB_000180 [Phenylobacterium sp.]|jgi:hypothetical protein
MNRLVGIVVVSAVLSGLFGYLNYIYDKGFKRHAGVLTKAMIVAPAPVADLAFVFNDRSSVVYQFNHIGQGEIDFDFLHEMADDQHTVKDSAMTNIEMASNGFVYLKFFRQSETRWNVAGQIGELNYRVNGENNPYVDDISKPFSFVVDTQGKLDDFTFSAGVGEASIGFIKQLMLNFQVSLPQEQAPAWKTEATDSAGRFVASYDFIPTDTGSNCVHLIKENLIYLSNEVVQSAVDPQIKNTTVTIDDSQARYRFVALNAWITSLEKQESIHMTTAGTIWSRMSSRLMVDKVGRKMPIQFASSFAAHSQQLEQPIERPKNHYINQHLNYRGGLLLAKK